MPYIAYRITHLVALAALALGTGGMLAGGSSRKTFAIIQGVALLFMLVTGFGLLAKLHLGFPHFAIVKAILWLLIGALPVLFRRLQVPVLAAATVVLALVGVMAWLGLAKPALW